jgi:hypothetical protein
MPQPIDYASAIRGPDLGQKLLTGLQIGQGIRSTIDAREAAEQARIAKEQYSQDLTAAMENPTAQGFASLALKYPQQSQAFKQSWDTLSQAQKDSEFSSGVQAYSALQSGKPDVAKAMLEKRIEAMKNSNQDASKLESMLSNLDSDPKGTMAHIGLLLSSVDGPRWAKIADTIPKEEERKIIKDVKGRQRYIDTKEFVFPEIKDTDSPEIKAKKEKVRFDNSTKLRGEFIGQSKDFKKVADANERVIAAAEDPSAAGDMALIFNFMKVLDPGSTVREGEFATAQNATGVSGRVQSLYNNIVRGERMTEAQRADFTGRTQKLFKSAQKQQDVLRGQYDKLANKFGLDPSTVLVDVVDREAQDKKVITVDY